MEWNKQHSFWETGWETDREGKRGIGFFVETEWTSGRVTLCKKKEGRLASQLILLRPPQRERAATTPVTGESTALAATAWVYLALLFLPGFHHSPCVALDLDLLSVTWNSSQVLSGCPLSVGLIAFLILHGGHRSLCTSQVKGGSLTAFGLVHQ